MIRARIRHKMLAGVLTVILPVFLASCFPTASPAANDDLQDRLEAAEARIAELTAEVATLGDSYEELLGDYDDLAADYQALLQGNQQADLRDPSWSEMKRFLEMDDTDGRSYVVDSFDCTGFAIALRDRAAASGIRCAYVEVGFSGGAGHAFNAFETTDRGLVYVDNTKALTR